MTFKSKVRKIVGSCYNQTFINDTCLLYPQTLVRGGGPSVEPNHTSQLFRIISGWYGTREDMLKLIYTSLDATQISANAHVWPSKWATDMHLTNPTNGRVRYKIYKCTLKCDDTGDAAGVFVHPTLPFAVGSANNPTQAPYATYWKFFDQSGRIQPNGVVASRTDPVLATNTAVNAYRAPVGSVWNVTVNTAGIDWESPDAVTNVPYDLAQTFGMSLSFIFPAMQRKLTIRCVASGSLGPYKARRHSWRNRVPSELRPTDWISDNKPNFIGKVSHFYFARVVGQKVVGAIATAPGGQGGLVSGTAGPAGVALPNYPEPFWRVPPSLAVRKTDRLAYRCAGDGKPTFSWFTMGLPPPHPTPPAVGTNMWLNTSGLIESGEAVNYFYDAMVVNAPNVHCLRAPDGDLNIASGTDAYTK